MNNALRAWSFLILLSLTLIVLGQLSLGREGLLLSLVIVLSVNAYIYFVEDERLLGLFPLKSVEGQDPWKFRSHVKKTCHEMRIPVPFTYIISNEAPQALVFGRSMKNSHIVVTEGFFDKLTEAEQKAVYAYLLVNIKNHNTLAFCVGSFMVSSLLGVANFFDILFRFLIFEKKNTKQIISQPMTRILAPVAGMLLQLSIRPSFYFSSDRTTAEYLQKADGTSEKDLASALWKMKSYSLTKPFISPMSAAHMFIVNPLTTEKWNSYFHAQPASENRIRALLGHYPL